jgi:hypothetical protein
MDSAIKKVGDSPASKVIPESAIIDNDTNTVETGAEKVILEVPIAESECDKCGHIEQEFKVLKGSIKKLIVDIREQMNSSENPFLNIQQMMPAQSAIYREDPPEIDRPVKPGEEPETPAYEADTEAPGKNERGNSPPAQEKNNHSANDHCPLADRREKANMRCALEGEYCGQDEICPVMQRLNAARGQSTSELCYECIRRGHQPERNATRFIRPECPSGLNGTTPCGRFVDRGYGAWYQGQPLPCMPQHAPGGYGNPAYGPGNGPVMQGPCSQCPYPGESQRYGRPPNDHDYYPSREPYGGDYSPYYRQGYTGHPGYRQEPGNHRQGCDGSCGYDMERSRNGFFPEGAREPGSVRPGPWQQPRGAYRPAKNQPDYYDEEPEYDYREASGQGRPARMHGKSRRRSLEYASDDSYVQPEPEPVVIDIPGTGSVRKKRKPHARTVPDIVVVDVEPENVVPQSIRTSRRKGL